MNRAVEIAGQPAAAVAPRAGACSSCCCAGRPRRRQERARGGPLQHGRGGRPQFHRNPVSRLRKKLEGPAAPRSTIHTIRGVGYLLGGALGELTGRTTRCSGACPGGSARCFVVIFVAGMASCSSSAIVRTKSSCSRAPGRLIATVAAGLAEDSAAHWRVDLPPEHEPFDYRGARANGAELLASSSPAAEARLTDGRTMRVPARAGTAQRGSNRRWPALSPASRRPPDRS